MSHNVVRVNRRKGLTKVKHKPAHGKPHDSHNTKTLDRPGDFVPALFDRSSLTDKETRRAPWWWNSKQLIILATAIGLCIAMLFGIYALAKNIGTDKRPVDDVTPLTLQEPPMIQMRPMRSFSALHSSPGTTQRASAGSNNGVSRYSSGQSDDGSGNPMSGNALDEYLALLDGNHKVVLPTDVSGSCDIGKSSIKDFSGCLIRNGAHAE